MSCNWDDPFSIWWRFFWHNNQPAENSIQPTDSATIWSHDNLPSWRVLRGSQRVPSQATSLIRTHSNRTYKKIMPPTHLQATRGQELKWSLLAWAQNENTLCSAQKWTHCCGKKANNNNTNNTHSWMLFSSHSFSKAAHFFFTQLAWLIPLQRSSLWCHRMAPQFLANFCCEIAKEIADGGASTSRKLLMKSAWNRHSQHLTTGPKLITGNLGGKRVEIKGPGPRNMPHIHSQRNNFGFSIKKCALGPAPIRSPRRDLLWRRHQASPVRSLARAKNWNISSSKMCPSSVERGTNMDQHRTLGPKQFLRPGYRRRNMFGFPHEIAFWEFPVATNHWAPKPPQHDQGTLWGIHCSSQKNLSRGWFGAGNICFLMFFCPQKVSNMAKNVLTINGDIYVEYRYTSYKSIWWNAPWPFGNDVRNDSRSWTLLGSSLRASSSAPSVL